jgi:hypothetical protein
MQKKNAGERARWLAVLATLAPAAISCAAVPDGAELERRGAIIGNVLVDPENIFNLEDPDENKALYRLANRVHVRTQPHVIR